MGRVDFFADLNVMSSRWILFSRVNMATLVLWTSQCYVLERAERSKFAQQWCRTEILFRSHQNEAAILPRSLRPRNHLLVSTKRNEWNEKWAEDKSKNTMSRLSSLQIFLVSKLISFKIQQHLKFFNLRYYSANNFVS